MSEQPINIDLLKTAQDAMRALNDLELRMRKLESFHHWISTQIYPDIKKRIEDLERVTQEQYQRLAKALQGGEEILARIERIQAEHNRLLVRFAEELQQQRIDPAVQQQRAEFGPNAGRQYQGNGPGPMWAGDPQAWKQEQLTHGHRDQTEQERLLQTYEHITNHPAFGGTMSFTSPDDPINPHTLVQEPAVCRICGGRASQHDSCYAPPSYKLVHEACLEKELAAKQSLSPFRHRTAGEPLEKVTSQGAPITETPIEELDPAIVKVALERLKAQEREPGEQDKSKA